MKAPGRASGTHHCRASFALSSGTENWYDLIDRMEKANRNGECDVIERFANSFGKNPHCAYNFETQVHTLQVNSQTIVIARKDFDDRKWQKTIRNAMQRRGSR